VSSITFLKNTKLKAMLEEYDNDQNSTPFNDAKNKISNDTDDLSNEEIEIENGFFTVDDGSTSTKEKSSDAVAANDNSGNEHVKDEADNSQTDMENEPYTHIQEDTIDAAFNSALGITKGNNSTEKNRTGVSEELLNDEKLADEKSVNED
jgi:hypothetical protein